MFDLESFINDCRMALAESAPALAIREVVARAVSEPASVQRALGTPELAQIEMLHHSPDLTILSFVWAPGMSIYPHDHGMWAVIGVYAGREDHAFYRRTSPGLAQVGSKQLDAKDATLLGPQIIHSVENPLSRSTGVLHVYGGDYLTVPRSGFDPDTFEESAYDPEKTRKLFLEANERMRGEAS